MLIFSRNAILFLRSGVELTLNELELPDPTAWIVIPDSVCVRVIQGLRSCHTPSEMLQFDSCYPVSERRAFKICSNRHVLSLSSTKQLPAGWRIGDLVVAQSDTGDGN